jgi:hypothetical protein
MVLPVGRSGWAIAAGYLGLLSFIPIFAPAALITAELGRRDISAHPDKHGMGRVVVGYVGGALFCVFWLWAILIS